MGANIKLFLHITKKGGKFFEVLYRNRLGDICNEAFIDGCTRLSAFFRVMIHVAKPGMFVTALFSFMSSWDEYMYSLTFINTPEKKTVQVGMKDFVGEYGTDWGMMMAAVTLSLIPALVFFGIVQKHLVTGLSSGAVKG